MKKHLLRVMSDSFLAWLRSQLGPQGKATVSILEARLSALLSSLPEDMSSPKGEMNEDGLIIGMSVLFGMLQSAYPDDWAPLTCQCLRLLLDKNVQAILHIALAGTASTDSQRAN
jgi:hypothetical protein